MRNIFVRSTVLITVTLLAVTASFAADESLGTWKLNMDKSKFSPSAPIKSLTTIREASDDGVKVTTTGERADGTPINSSYTAKYDGKDCAVSGAPYDSIAIKQVNAHTFTAAQKNSTNKYNTTVRSVISSDGKTMTNTVKGVGADGNPIIYTMVYERQ